MPIYEYSCKACSATFEQLVKRMNGEHQEVKCPKCGSSATARSLSVFAVGAQQTPQPAAPGLCGRCGGPGPCAMGD